MKVAVLHQELEPPVIGGLKKPKKPGGYRDSGADVIYFLQTRGIAVATPKKNPNPADDNDWTFPDHEEGILDAISKGATHLWANTILFAQHPLQTSHAIGQYQDVVRVIGQPPNLVDFYDDKNYVNTLLRRSGQFRLPQFWIITSKDADALHTLKPALSFPIVAKPIRGRGSHGVKLCHDMQILKAHAEVLLEASPSIMLEQYLSGVDGTITVMPPSSREPKYVALPFVERFNHEDGVAPYNGVVAVTQNSQVVPENELGDHHKKVMRECEEVAKLLKVTSLIRIDVRQVDNSKASEFAIFDVNMKPNMTGPGRPGRENQASLTAMAASELSWDYGELLTRILETAKSLKELRAVKLSKLES